MNARRYKNDAVNLAVQGRTSIAVKLDGGHKIEFCGAFELASRSYDETASSDNPGIFQGLVNFVDCVLEEHLKTTTIFKTVQNKLLDCMLSVILDCILEDVKTTDYLAIQADETIDTSTHCATLNKVQERFYEFILLPHATADTVTTAVLESLKTILPEGQRGKLITQVHDGAAMMRGATDAMQHKVHNIYGSAHYLHY